MEKPNFIRRIYNWTVSWAETPYAMPALALIALVESSFFPIPPDVLLVALCFALPRKWWHYALVCTVFSVLGGVLGWGIGHLLWSSASEFFFTHIPGFKRETFAIVEGYYKENAFLFILTAAFTPIPYKIFTIASGVFEVPLATLVGASFLGRGGRFFLVAGVIRVGGPTFKPFVEKYLEWVAALGFVLLVAGFYVIKVLR